MKIDKKLKYGDKIEVRDKNVLGITNTTSWQESYFIAYGKNRSVIAVYFYDTRDFLSGESFRTILRTNHQWRLPEPIEYIPYDYDKLLLNKCVERKTGNVRGVIIAQNNLGVMLGNSGDSEMVTYKELLDEYKELDGSPLGVKNGKV